jgi:hypothetical protein
MPAEWEEPMPLNTLLERGRTVAEYGRGLAGRRRHREEPYLSPNPYGRVPTLEVDGIRISSLIGK